MRLTRNIDDSYLTSLLADLVGIRSVFPDEYEIALYLESELLKLGIPVERVHLSERRFNLLARLGSGSPILCLNAHMDTVPPSGDSIPKSRIQGDVLYGLGACDDKASVAAMMGAFKSIVESGIQLNGTLDLLLSVDEEGDARGVRTAADKGYRCDFAITGEPTSLDLVQIHCGLIFLDIITHGKSTHGSIPHQGINAIDRMYELVSGLRNIVTDFPEHQLIGPPTLNLGIIRAGDRPNRVPDRCEASVDIRIVPPTKVEEVLSRIDDFFGTFNDSAEYVVTKQGGPLDTPQGAEVVQALNAACEEVLGRKPGMSQCRGWTEAESFYSKLGVDSVVFGPGALVQAHSSDEYVSLSEMHQASRVYMSSALRLLGAKEKTEQT